MTWRAVLLVWAAFAALLVLYPDELGWARAELPKYLEGRIGSPLERRLYREARERIERGQAAEAVPLLERSLGIDPYGEAGYWMGRAWLAQGDRERALDAFQRYLAIDPTPLDAQLAVAEILEQSGRTEEARASLRAALAFFRDGEERQRPQADPEQQAGYNRKARKVHLDYAAGRRRLERALERLDAQAPRAEGTT